METEVVGLYDCKDTTESMQLCACGAGFTEPATSPEGLAPVNFISRMGDTAFIWDAEFCTFESTREYVKAR